MWRVSEFSALNGAGGLVAPGRWHSKGRPVVYMAETSALAMLEVLVGYEVAQIPATFQLLAIDTPDDLAITRWPADQDHHDPALTTAWGDAFLHTGDAAIARVPSVVAPYGWNCLLNPLHPDAARIRLLRAERYPWDTRLFDRT